MAASSSNGLVSLVTQLKQGTISKSQLLSEMSKARTNALPALNIPSTQRPSVKKMDLASPETNGSSIEDDESRDSFDDLEDEPRRPATDKSKPSHLARSTVAESTFAAPAISDTLAGEPFVRGDEYTSDIAAEIAAVAMANAKQPLTTANVGSVSGFTVSDRRSLLEHILTEKRSATLKSKQHQQHPQRPQQQERSRAILRPEDGPFEYFSQGLPRAPPSTPSTVPEAHPHGALYDAEPVSGQIKQHSFFFVQGATSLFMFGCC
jgi:hypothetical protein